VDLCLEDSRQKETEFSGMLKKVFAVVLVLSFAGMASATNLAEQNNSINAMLAAMNFTSGGPVTGGLVGQFGGTIMSNDGYGIAAGQQAGIALLAVQVQGPGSAITGAEVDAGQMVASAGGTGMAGQGSNVGLTTALMKGPGMGGLSATSSAVVNQAEVVNTPAGMISNTNTSGASSIAGMGPCSTGTVISCVEIESCGGSAFVNPCPPPVCPPVCPPCPQPTPTCGDC
jgi:hypothetical protein